MDKNGKEVNSKRLAHLLKQTTGSSIPGSLLSQLPGKLQYMEYFHPEDFPSSGGFFIIDNGGVDVFIRSSTSAGWGQPNFVDSLTEGDTFCLCPLEKTVSRILTYAPVTSVRGYLLAWDNLLALLEGSGEIREFVSTLIMNANSRLAHGLAKAAVQIPEGWKEPLPEAAEIIKHSAVSESDFSGCAPAELACGETWSDENAAGAFIAKGRVYIGERKENRTFCVRGSGVQGTWGILFLKAQSETTIYPISRECLSPGKKEPLPCQKLIIELTCSPEVLSHPLVSVLDQAREFQFGDYLQRARYMEEETKEKTVAELAAIQRTHKRMPLIRAHDVESAWDAAVEMIAKYEGKKRLSKEGTKSSSAISKDPVSGRAPDYGMRPRTVSVHSGDLERLAVPIIAVQKDETPLILEPCGRYMWVHNPLKGSYKTAAREIEAKLPGLAYELIPVMDKGLAQPRRIISFALSGFRTIMGRIILASVLIAAFCILTPIATNWVFSFAIPSGQLNVLNSIGLALLTSAAAVGLFSMFRAMLLLSLESLATSRITSALWSHLFRLPVRFFRKYRVGDLSLRMQAVDQIRVQLTSSVLTIGVNGLFSLVYVGVMFYYSAKLSWYGLGMVCLPSIILLVGMKVVSKRQRRMLFSKAGEQSLLHEMVRGILTVRTSASVKRMYNRWLGLLGSEMGMVYRSDTATMWTTNLLVGIPTLGTLIMYWIGGDDIIGGKLPLGVFIAFNAAFNPFVNAIITGCQTGMGLTTVGPLWERIRPVFEAEEERPGGGTDPGKLKGKIEVSSCTFRYSEDGQNIIRDVSFTINPGEFVAITGPSGSGKTTLIRLLLGFEEPTSGQVFYDGHDLRQVDPRSIRRQIGVVLQQSELIRGSIKENLRVNAPLAAQEEIEEAARNADIHDDIMAMPMRYETIVSEGAATFSGGQRQRLAIARALVAKPKILFFDEATSSLDNISQDRVESSLDRLNATRIVVAHRLSTIEKADRIIVLDRGKIVQEDSFEKLMAQEGLFKNMVTRQLI